MYHIFIEALFFFFIIFDSLYLSLSLNKNYTKVYEIRSQSDQQFLTNLSPNIPKSIIFLYRTSHKTCEISMCEFVRDLNARK